MQEITVLANRWREEAPLIRERYADDSLARLCEVHANELDAAIQAAEERTLTLTQASHLSGYGPDHLGRMVREGRVPNAGRKGAPRIRVRDLPRKAGLHQLGPDLQLPSSSKEQIARSVLSPGGEG